MEKPLLKALFYFNNLDTQIPHLHLLLPQISPTIQVVNTPFHLGHSLRFEFYSTC